MKDIMLYLGIDPSTITGWSLIKDDKLLQYGIINSSKIKNIGERLKYISEELQIVLIKYKPDIIGIEDVLLGMSGVKILSLLSRISGVIILECYRYCDNIHILNVKDWKKNCGLNITGNAQKWQILLEVVKKYNLIDKQQLIDIEIIINDTIGNLNNYKQLIENDKKELDLIKRKGKKEKIDISINENEIKKNIQDKKNHLKEIEKNNIKIFKNISNTIFSLTNISEDIADSIGISLTVQRLQKGS